jgi:RNA polymerase sigma-70 factor (ECF subfamily)
VPGHDPKIIRLRAGAPLPADSSPDTGLTLDEALGRHLGCLYGAARLLTGDPAAAEDLVQEAAIAAFRGWGELRAHAAVKSWLLRILHRTFLNTLRHAGRRPPFVDIDIDELIGHPILGGEPVAPVPASELVLSEEVERALAALPHGFREVVWLVDVEELTIAETADVLELPAGTVASRVHRARRLLREALTPGGPRKDA